MRDCERDRHSGFQSLQSALNNADLPAPDEEDTFAHDDGLAVMLRLIPVNANDGCFEDILVDSCHDTALKHARVYVNEVLKEYYQLNSKKALVHGICFKTCTFKLIEA